MRRMRCVLATVGVLAMLGCGHVQPAETAGVPPPWPKPSPRVVEKSQPEPPAEAPKGKPPVPGLKDEVVPKSPTPPHSS